MTTFTNAPFILSVISCFIFFVLTDIPFSLLTMKVDNEAPQSYPKQNNWKGVNIYSSWQNGEVFKGSKSSRNDNEVFAYV